MSEIGHNVDAVDTVAAAELRQFVERIERLEEEGKAVNSDKADVYGEARIEEETILQTYMAALGME